MVKEPLDNFSKFTANRFEAIIVAAKHARKVNEILTEKEEIEKGEEVKPRMEKIVSLALSEVLEGKVKFERPKSAKKKYSK